MPSLAAHETAEDFLTTPGADIRDAGAEQVRQLRQLCDESLYYFGILIFNYRDLVPHIHGRVSEVVRLWESRDDYRRLMIQLARETFKSSLVTRANSLRQLCREPNQPIAVFNEKEDNVKRWGRAIKDVIQSSRIFHVLYPEMLPPWIGPNGATQSKPHHWAWNDLAFDLPGKDVGEPEYSWSGHGVGSATAGGHWPKLIYDDIIGRKAATSPAVMADAYDFVDKTPYLLRPAEKGRWLCVCTTWTYDDVYVHMIRNYGFRVYKRPILENGKSIFPEKLTTEELLAMFERDPEGFSAQMLLNPRPGKEQSFDPHWFRYFQINPATNRVVIEPESRQPDRDAPDSVPLSQIRKVVIVDPAATENKDPLASGARTGIVVVGVDAWNRLYLLEGWAGRVDPWDAVQQMLGIAQRWRAPTLAIEENGVGKVYLSVARVESQRRGLPIAIRPVSSKSRREEKDTRIVGLIPDFRDGNWHLNRQGAEEVVTELLEYPHSRTRDLIDAMGYTREVLRRPYSPEESAALWARRIQHQRERDPITGY